jgi:hypothetical protein
MLQNINHRFRTAHLEGAAIASITKNSTTADWISVRKYPEVMFFLSNSGWLKYKNHWRLVMFSESQLDPICADWKPTRSTHETNIPMDDSNKSGVAMFDYQSIYTKHHQTAKTKQSQRLPKMRVNSFNVFVSSDWHVWKCVVAPICACPRLNHDPYRHDQTAPPAHFFLATWGGSGRFWEW